MIAKSVWAVINLFHQVSESASVLNGAKEINIVSAMAPRRSQSLQDG